MHRKSLEAAEHIRKQDENELFSEKSPSTTDITSSSISMSPLVKKLENDGDNDDLKTESVANLRAKAKEHSAKLMVDVNIINNNKDSYYSVNNKYQINNNNNERKINNTENNSTSLSDAEDTNSYSLDGSV
jgi:hypothetical protein